MKSDTFKKAAEIGLDIRDQLNQQRIKQKQLNHDILVPIIETILFLGRQELAFGAHRGESSELNIEEPNENDGNFRAALRLRLRAQSCTRAEYNSLRAPRAGNLGRTPRDDNRDDVSNCHEVPIKEYLRKWNFVSFHLFVFAETLT